MYYCGSSVCGSSGGVPKGTNVAVGDYGQTGDKYQCCGDDEGENYITRVCEGGTVADLRIHRDDDFCTGKGVDVLGVCCRPTDNCVHPGPSGTFTCDNVAFDMSCDDCVSSFDNENDCELNSGGNCEWDEDTDHDGVGGPGVCVKVDWWWDSNYGGGCCEDFKHMGDTGLCEANPTECYEADDPLMCTYLPPNDASPQQGWWNQNPQCFTSFVMSPCCRAFQYNQWGYYRTIPTQVWN